MRRKGGTAIAALLLASAASLLGCSGGDEDDRATPADPRQSPEALTEALMLLWQDRDRESADRLGTDEALDALFRVTPPDAAVEVVECLDEPGIPGARTCLARGGGQTVLVTAEPAATPGFWRAVAILPVR